MKVLVTGAAGFIGMHLCERLLARGDEVVGFDNLNDYYPVALKEARLARLAGHPGFRCVRGDLADTAAVDSLFAEGGFARVAHLAAQAGVRYSLKNPLAYAQANLLGFVNILEGCRHNGVEHLVYASSSSVYGGNAKMPFAEEDAVDHPVSLYAATKKSNELMAHTYSHLYGLPATGLRFFTVYGPWGRPDMAYWSFTEKILAGQTIDVFNHGQMRRDFTYVDDIVEGVLRVLDKPATADPDYDPLRPTPATARVPHRVFNIGASEPVALLDFIETLERALGRSADKRFLPMQDGDVPATYADTRRLEAWVGFAPKTPLATGIGRFVDWYRAYTGR
ncbi:NAD-dependent epimerase [Rhodocyclus tenuis]|uniref:UDP-glucuronate 4-epimerase n=1 Tax=Rhodocyclus tenuis TaxID=1066 RepID=A0A840G1L3_RHOTE|nr:NAD-dependent epimerase [Rhodocyclus tenuis]MBB4246323.1 UDP-glucuronate 4-epimerase [Rhodocyclus tenuis]